MRVTSTEEEGKRVSNTIEGGQHRGGRVASTEEEGKRVSNTKRKEGEQHNLAWLAQRRKEEVALKGRTNDLES